jgi:ATP-dependent Clp protease ATP-binding subunit ClpX
MVESEDLMRFGLIPEFIGRFPVVVATKSLSLDQMIHVITEPKNALMKQYAYQFAMHDVDLHCTPEALKRVAEIALQKNTGARGLRSIFEKLLTTAMFVVPDTPGVHTVLIDEAAIEGKRSVLLLKGDLTVQEFLESEKNAKHVVGADDRVEEVATV